MFDKVKKYLKDNNLENAALLVAFSGGADSTALLHICSVLHQDVTAVHLNHGWRGEESDGDEVCAENFCKKLGIKFYSEKLSGDISPTETDAREARYGFFERCAEKFNADAIFLAHNKNDNVETLIYRLIKGTGLKGLCSIPKTRGIYHRPLLDITREEIEQYVKDNKLEIRQDSSNDNINYARNFIRKEILPKFLELNPNSLDAIENLTRIAQGQQKIIEETTLSVMKNKETLDTQRFLSLPHELRMSVLHNFLKDDLKNRAYWKFEELLNIIQENSKYPSVKKTSLNSKFFLAVNKLEIAKVPVL